MWRWEGEAGVTQSTELATLGQEVVGSIPASPPTGWVSVSIIRQAETEVMVSPLCVCVAARKIVRRES